MNPVEPYRPDTAPESFRVDLSGYHPLVPRIKPAEPAARSALQQRLLRPVGGDKAGNLFATVIRNPELFEAWLPLCLHMLGGSGLAARHQELIILRTAWLCGSSYQWAHHVRAALIAGIGYDEIAALDGPLDADWSPEELALLEAVDELHSNHALTESTWVRLTTFLSTDQLIALPMLVGHCTMVAGTLNTLRIAPDAAVAAAAVNWPAR